ncbi:MAG: hypothetical protein WAO17_08975 [Candidatus Sulfotelmatobacter sp.]
MSEFTTSDALKTKRYIPTAFQNPRRVHADSTTCLHATAMS